LERFWQKRVDIGSDWHCRQVPERGKSAGVAGYGQRGTGVPGTPVQPPFPLAIVRGEPTAGTKPSDKLTSMTFGFCPPFRRKASGCARGATGTESTCKGGSVFGKQTHGVPSEQNPHPPLGAPTPRLDDGNESLINAVVKSISIGKVSEGGNSGGDFGEEERFLLIPCGGDCGAVLGDVSTTCFFRRPRSSQIHDPSEQSPQRASLSADLTGLDSVGLTLIHTQSLPRTHVSQVTSALGAGLANCVPGRIPSGEDSGCGLFVGEVVNAFRRATISASIRFSRVRKSAFSCSSSFILILLRSRKAFCAARF
jgi:hypothetical protein